jgi:hypothetical protein
MTNEITLTIRRSGAMGFDINIATDQNPALQDEAMAKLDILLDAPTNKTWLTATFPWSIEYNLGISYRHLCGEPKSLDALLNNWVKACSQKYNKNLRIDK